MSVPGDTATAAGEPRALARFATGSVPSHRRVSGWEDYHASTLVGLRTAHAGGARFRAETSTLDLADMRIARVTGSEHSVRREASDIAAHPVSGALVYVPLAGLSTFVHRSGGFDLGPGRGVVCSGDTAFARDLIGGVDEIVVRLPRTTVEELTGAPTWTRPTVLDLDRSPAARASGHDFAEVADGLIGRGLRAGSGLHDRLLDLLGTMLSGLSGSVDIVDDVLAAIADHHREPDLSAGRIARLTGVSERHLSRILAEAGHSLPQAVAAARLETARSILADPDRAGASIAEVAVESGFRSQAKLSRSYAARFGITPLKHRRQMRAPEEP